MARAKQLPTEAPQLFQDERGHEFWLYRGCRFEPAGTDRVCIPGSWYISRWVRGREYGWLTESADDSVEWIDWWAGEGFRVDFLRPLPV